MERTAAILTLAQRDRASVWHPFTQMQTARDCIPIRKGQGVYLYAEDGSRYLDGISSWWVNLHGHAHPYIAEKISAQLQMLEHVIFADFTHSAAVELAERLIQLLPGQMSKIFYTDNGSTSVEAAIKIALQYWYNRDPSTLRTKVICFNKGYHGDTFGAMSAAGKNPLNKPFWSHLFEVESIEPPYHGQEERSLQQLEEALNKNSAACFIFEPLILGAGGMKIYSSEGLNALLKLCRERGVLLIADEVMTGFGRTGSLFACELLHEKPDLICLSKGLTGGFLPLGATACTATIFEAFLSNDPSKAFLHGHSYTANPLACCAALASLDLLERESCTAQRRRISDSHRHFCMKWKQHPKLKRCESLGTILVLEYFSKENSSYFHSLRNNLYHFFLDRHILLRPLGNVLYVMPPYCITVEELAEIYESIIFTLGES